SILNIHLRSHNDEKPFKLMKSHSNVLNEKEFKCALCNKSFTQKGHLNIHLRSHSNEKPFKCSVCSKSFTRKCNRNNHLRLHCNEKSSDNC
ncbi:hypothetical protein L9F63_020212, partial [Diploptera punctata]